MNVGRIKRCAILLGAFCALSLCVGATSYAFWHNSLAFIGTFALFVTITGSQIGAMTLLGACAIFSIWLLYRCCHSPSGRYGHNHIKA